MNETDAAAIAAESASASNVLLAVMMTLGIFAVVFAIAWYILQVIAYWKIFTKAGRPGWHSIIPFLNKWDQVDLSWNRKMAWAVTCLSVVGCIISIVISNQQNQGLQISSTLNMLSYIIVIAAVVLGVVCEYKLAKAFGKGVGFFLGLVFLNPIFMLILGFGSAQYLGRQE